MARHAYLGDLEDVAHPHTALYAHGAIVELPLMYLRGIVLFPGEELPLRVLSETNLETIRSRLENEASMLAVLCPGQSKTQAYGTTVRVERFGVTDNSAMLTGAAKQRFRLLSTKTSPGGHNTVGVIQIVADMSPPRMPFPAPPRRHQSLDTHKKELKRRQPPSRFPSYWSLAEYALFDATHLVARIQQIMIASAHCNWFQKLASHEPHQESMVKHLMSASDEQDPVRFAFWIASNLPVSHTARLELLQTECIVRLLQREISILNELDESIYCTNCGCFLAHTRDIFSMTNDGAAGTFVNPGGFVHQIMTVREVHMDSLFVDSMRSTEDSWFPGYAWSIAHCIVCYNHLGWQFDCVESPLASPARFFGFRRTALTQSWSADRRSFGAAHGDDDDDDDEEDEDDDEDQFHDDDAEDSDSESRGSDVSDNSGSHSTASDHDYFDARETDHISHEQDRQD